MTALPQPRFGDREALTCLVLLPYNEVVALSDSDLGALMRSLQRAEMELRVDPSWIVDLPGRHENYLRQRVALEKYRERAIRSPVDDDARPAGFVEVHP